MTPTQLLPLVAALALPGVALAQQTATFDYSGTVISVEGDPSVVGFALVGDEAGGSFTFDLDAEGNSPFVLPDGTPIDLGFNFYEALGLNVGVNDTIIESEQTPLALVLDDISVSPSPTGEIGVFDQLSVGVALTDGQQRVGQVTVNFVGESSWFNGTDIPNPDTLGLENLLSASVTIEFNTTPVFELDENGNPIFPEDFDNVLGKVIIELDTISLDNSVIATIGCSVASMSSPPASADARDTRAFVSYYVTNNPRADFDGDGFVGPIDAGLFVEGYARCNTLRDTDANTDVLSNRSNGPTPEQLGTATAIFFGALEQGELAADVNADGRVDIRDGFAYLRLITAGF